MKLYDIHSHILPGVDDGCQTIEESLRALASSREQGVEMVAATPHYYPRETVRAFLRRRHDAVQTLADALNSSQMPRPGIIFGAEVAYYDALTREPNLRALCLGKSSYLLLEMPTEKWPSRVLRDLETIRSSMGLIPIIAHVERCFPYQDKNTLRDLLDLDVLIQVNAGCLLSKGTRRTAKKLFKADIVHFLGTDCHNMTSRPPALADAFDVLYDWGMDDTAELICENSAYLFQQAAGT